MRWVAVAALLALVCGQAWCQAPPPVATFNVASPYFKSMAIGVAECRFWSHLSGTFPLESACYLNGAAIQIEVYVPATVGGGTFGYCEDGSAYQPTVIPHCAVGVAGGSFTWLIAPTPTPGVIALRLAASPLGGAEAAKETTF